MHLSWLRVGLWVWFRLSISPVADLEVGARVRLSVKTGESQAVSGIGSLCWADQVSILGLLPQGDTEKPSRTFPGDCLHYPRGILCELHENEVSP